MDKPGLWNFAFAYVLMIGVFNSIGFGMVQPLIPGYAVSLGATLAFAGVFTGIFSITALIGRPFAGLMGDKLNKKWLLLAFLVMNGLATLMYVVAPTIGLLVPVRIFHGLMFSVTGTISMALGAEFIPRERLGEGIGFLGMVQIIGMAVGPNIGIFLLENYSYDMSFIVSGSLIIATGLAVLALRYKFTPPPKKEGEGKKRLRLSDLIAVELLPNVGFAALFALGIGLASSYLLIVGYERGIGNIGLYFVINAAIGLVSRPLIGRITDKKGVHYAILPGYIFAATAMMLIGFSYTLWMILLAAVFVAMGNGGSLPAIQADCIRKLHISRRTVATGTFLIGMDVGMTVGQIFGGVVSDAFGFRIAFTGAGFLMLAGFACYSLYTRSNLKKAVA